MIGKRFLNVLLSLAIGLAEVLGMKLKVQLNEHRIRLSLIEPDKLTKRAYDGSHYENGNIFVENHANPVKAKFDEAKEKVEMIASKRYKYFMRMTLLKDLIRSTESDGLTKELMLKILIVIGIANLGIMAFFIILVMG